MPHKLHERALRLHIADTRALTETSNPWLDREDAFLLAPLMVRVSHALVDVLEYLLDTNDPSIAWDQYRRMLHQNAASLPAPLLAWSCECTACEPADDGNSSSPAVRYYNEKAIERALRGVADGARPTDLPTEPIEIVA